MLFTDPTMVEEFKQELSDTNKQVTQLQARQLFLINKLDRAGVAASDGARTMIEWTATTLDTTTATARDLVTTANHIYRRDPILFEDMQAGTVTLDRAIATLRLIGTDASDTVIDRSFDLDLTAVARLTHHHRRIRRTDEQQTFRDRYLVMQPSLDESRYRGWFELPGLDGSIVDTALTQRADEIRMLPGGDHFTRPQRLADALVMISQDSLNSDGEQTETGGGANMTVFVDLNQANGTSGEYGAEIQYGPRIGPAVLEELVCNSSVQIVGLEDGRPVVTSDNTKTIPPAIRSFVAWRDGGCAITGCTSRYRLQPHHIRHRHHDGDHDPDNLVTLCWPIFCEAEVETSPQARLSPSHSHPRHRLHPQTRRTTLMQTTHQTQPRTRPALGSRHQLPRPHPTIDQHRAYPQTPPREVMRRLVAPERHRTWRLRPWNLSPQGGMKPGQRGTEVSACDRHMPYLSHPD